MINIILTDDHQIIRDGLKSLLKDVQGLNIVAEAENGQDAIRQLEAHPETQLMLLDINMPIMNGIETTTILNKQYPDLRILALSMHDEEEYISEILQAGAHGYILKKAGREDLVTAIHTLNNGGQYLCKEVSKILIDTFTHRKTSNQNSQIQLTDREQEILKLIAQEFTNQEIADKLFISARTVDTHRRNLLQKLNVKNTAGLVRWAVQKKII